MRIKTILKLVIFTARLASIVIIVLALFFKDSKLAKIIFSTEILLFIVAQNIFMNVCYHLFKNKIKFTKDEQIIHANMLVLYLYAYLLFNKYILYTKLVLTVYILLVIILIIHNYRAIRNNHDFS